jgi:hypothetical protein
MDEGTKKTDGIPESVVKRHKRNRVNARTLQAEIGYKGGFTAWLKRIINNYGLVEGKDYEVNIRPKLPPGRGAPFKDYILSPEAVEKIITGDYIREHINKNQISNFKIKGRELSVFKHKGELWFFEMDFKCFLQIAKRSGGRAPNEGRMRIVTFLPPRICESTYAVFTEWNLLWFVFRSKNNIEAREISKWLVNEALPVIRKAFDKPPSALDWFRRFIKSFRKEAPHEQS